MDGKTLSGEDTKPNISPTVTPVLDKSSVEPSPLSKVRLVIFLYCLKRKIELFIIMFLRVGRY